MIKTRKPMIMVIEDESLLLEAITKKLNLAGFEVIPCATSQAALDNLEQANELPAAIWLDYYLKDTNGLALLHSIRKKKSEWARIPVFVVSNSASSDKVDSMLALGVKKYILKAEYRLEQIIEIIQKFIEEEKNYKRSRQ